MSRTYISSEFICKNCPRTKRQVKGTQNIPNEKQVKTMFDEKFFDDEEPDVKTQKTINCDPIYELDVDKYIRAYK